MIDVDYNEYKETLAENMKLIVENNRLKEVEKEHQKLNGELREEVERLNNIINKALEKSKGLQYRFGYVLDDLIYLLMQGSDKE